uniref:Uncharacterized protein n=1 Tax=mine drainage metagenome TaxID=410659 RepID=E6PHX8_9ZZZZ
MVRTERSRGIRRQKGGDLTYAATEPNLQQFRDLTPGCQRSLPADADLAEPRLVHHSAGHDLRGR